jgi:uncharacterized protein HemY
MSSVSFTLKSKSHNSNSTHDEKQVTSKLSVTVPSCFVSGSMSDDDLSRVTSSSSQSMPDTQLQDAARVWRTKGDNCAEKGDYIKAVHAWNESLRYEISAEVYECISQVQLELDHTFAAVQAAHHAVRLAPTCTSAYVTLARAQLNHGEFRLAHRTFARAVRLDPTSQELRAEFQEIGQIVAKADAINCIHAVDQVRVLQQHRSSSRGSQNACASSQDEHIDEEAPCGVANTHQRGTKRRLIPNTAMSTTMSQCEMTMSESDVSQWQSLQRKRNKVDATDQNN